MSGLKSMEHHFPDTLVDLVSRNTEESPPKLDSFYSSVDESDYSLEDWAEALIGFDAWLAEENSTKRPFNTMVGYVNCCTMMNPVKIALPSLNIIVNQSLTEYGFDAGN